MADVFGAEFFGGIKKLFRDMGDDSHAEVVALGGGDEVLGAVAIDQTTPGTTDSVSVATGQGAGATIGVTTGAAVVTDANGTIQQYLRGLVTLIAAKIGVTVADGDNAVLGTTTDAKVITDAAGTIQQYLRGIVHLLISILTVKIDQTTDGETNRVNAGGALEGPGSPTVDSYTSAVVDLAASTADQEIIAAPGVDKQIWVYGFALLCDTAAGVITFQTEDDVAITGAMAFSDEGGISVSVSGNFAMPIWKLPTNKALEADTGACTVDGWICYGIISI